MVVSLPSSTRLFGQHVALMHRSLPGFFFNYPQSTEFSTLSLHDALPISCPLHHQSSLLSPPGGCLSRPRPPIMPDRKSTRLNSSHSSISYAVFRLKKKTTSPLRNEGGLSIIGDRSTSTFCFRPNTSSPSW